MAIENDDYNINFFLPPCIRLVKKLSDHFQHWFQRNLGRILESELKWLIMASKDVSFVVVAQIMNQRG